MIEKEPQTYAEIINDGGEGMVGVDIFISNEFDDGQGGQAEVLETAVDKRSTNEILASMGSSGYLKVIRPDNETDQEK